jgi:hypothetical protein
MGGTRLITSGERSACRGGLPNRARHTDAPAARAIYDHDNRLLRH